MPLDILVTAVPAENRTTADWLRRVSTAAESATGAVYGVRGDSESEWEGKAGEIFRDRMREMGVRGDEVAGMATSFADALTVFADEMDTVHARMNQARATAAEGGLTVADNVIHDPPASADPGHGGPGHRLVENQPDHDANVAARQHKIDKYNEAAQTVQQGRDIQYRAESAINKFVAGQLKKSYITVPTVLAGAAGVHLNANSAWRTLAQSHAKSADAASKIMNNPLVSKTTQQRMSALFVHHKVNAEVPPANVNTRASRLAEKLPKSLKNFLQRGIGPDKFRVSAAGGGLSLLGAGVSLAQGKDPGKILVTTTTSTVAAAWAGGTVVGGGAILTVGWPLVVGAAVTAGAGWAYDEYADDVHEAMQGDDPDNPAWRRARFGW